MHGWAEAGVRSRRVSESEETLGLDVSEYAGNAYQV